MGSFLRWGLFVVLSVAGCAGGLLLTRPGRTAGTRPTVSVGELAAPNRTPGDAVSASDAAEPLALDTFPSQSDDQEAARLAPQEPSVASQVAPLADDINELRQTLQSQQSSLLEALSRIRKATEAKQAPLQPAQVPPQPDRGDGQAPPGNAEAGDAAGEDRGEDGQAMRRSIGDRPLISDEGDDKLRLQVQDDDIRHVLELLSRQGDLNILASPDVTGTVTASLSGVTVEEALSAVLKSAGYAARREGSFIFVGTPESLRKMHESTQAIETRVFRPDYITATDLQTLITPLLSRRGTATVGRTTSASSSFGVAQSINGSGQIAVSPPADQGIPSDGQSAGGDRFAGNEVVVVRDYEGVLERIELVVAEVDRRPMQVAIEAVILSVSLDDSNTLGVNFELLRDKNNTRLISGSPLDNLANIQVDTGGLKFGFLDSSLATFIEAVESVGDTDVVAAPRVMCLNKQRAEILIGEELGYVSTTVTENSATQSVEFLEVGTQLRIRPFISSDGNIRMEVHPELSTGSVRVEQGLTLPDKEVTQVTTNIMCPNGQTIVIGGLIREDLETNSTAIPFLGAAPFIGPLFRQKTETTKRQELIVLLTPRIVDDATMAHASRAAADTFGAQHENYADKMSPVGRRAIGRRYLRLARSAWAAGDARAAIRYVHLAIHYDPQDVAATALRNEIVGAFPEFEQPIHRRLREGLPLWERPMTNYARRGYPWQDPPATHDATDIPVMEREIEVIEPAADGTSTGEPLSPPRLPRSE